MNDAVASAVPTGPRWRRFLAEQDRYDRAGSRPPLATVAMWAYGSLGVFLAGLGVVATVVGRANAPTDDALPLWPIRPFAPLGFTLPIACWCGALALASRRIARGSPAARGPGWGCLGPLLHAACGWAGALAMAFGGLLPSSLRDVREAGMVAAAFGMLFGAVSAVPVVASCRRGMPLFATDLVGIVVLMLAMTLGW